MKEVTSGYVTDTGQYFEHKEKAEECEIRKELEIAAFPPRGTSYSIWLLMDYLFKNFYVKRK